ncbi:hypothetical protein NQ318_004502 [Aromia moschata]|uniref:Uncharacterized protein n=1 Tax=Aromia moschata TaxID=1265417 RepID=A0AAV8X7D9_9CUCU|nr:hypothetical protein NQ318_004502 [Aromia moschata]
MLLDKSIQIDSLGAKLKNYEDNVKELLEYRQLKCDVYKAEFQQCENKEHTKCLLVMQNDLQNYRRTIEDKNQQILTLNSTNRDLQEKIEEMLLQTRNDIQNLSHKYSLPQLEQMTLELKNAEENQLLNIKNNAEKEKTKYEDHITKLQKELNILEVEIKNLKQYTEELITDNTKLKLQLKDHSKVEKSATDSHQISENAIMKNEYEQLKDQLKQIMTHLQNKNEKDSTKTTISLKCDMEMFLLTLKEITSNEIIIEKIHQWRNQLDTLKSESGENVDTLQKDLREALKQLQKTNGKIKSLQEAIDDLKNAKTIAEGEKCTYQFQLKDCESQLEQACKTIKYLENEIENLTKMVREKTEIIIQLEQNSKTNGIERLKDQLKITENALKMCEEDKKELNDLLQKVKFQLEESKKETVRLQQEVTEVNDKAVRRNLEKELKEAENQLEQSKIEDGDVNESEYFKKCLQAEILKNELKLRDDLQQEYLRKIKEIEIKYQKVCITTTEVYKEQIDKFKNQEVRYREHLSKILAECAKKINEFENEKQDLIGQIHYLHEECDKYKRHMAAEEKNYTQIIRKIQMDAEKNVEDWKKWSKQFVSNCLKIETINKTSRDNVLTGIKNTNTEIAAIEKSYKEKLKKYIKK